MSESKESKPVVDESWDDVPLPEEYWGDEFEDDELDVW
jgi:hypothetical protein